MLKSYLRLVGNLHFNKIPPGDSYTHKCMLKSQLEPNRLSGKLGSATHQLGDLAQVTSDLLVTSAMKNSLTQSVVWSMPLAPGR